MAPIKEFKSVPVKQEQQRPTSAKERLEMERRRRLAKEIYRKHQGLMERLKDA